MADISNVDFRAVDFGFFFFVDVSIWNSSIFYVSIWIFIGELRISAKLKMRAGVDIWYEQSNSIYISM